MTRSSSASRSTALDLPRQLGRDIEETQGTALNFPLIGDADRKVADLNGMIHPNANDTLTVRSVFVVGPDKKIEADADLPGQHGRNVSRSCVSSTRSSSRR